MMSSTKSFRQSFPFIVCIIAALFYFYDYLIQSSTSIMTDALMHDFHVGAGELGLMATCFYYSYTLMQIPAGMILDRFGARLVLTSAVLISAVGVMLFSLTSDITYAGVARALIGFGSAFSFISTLYLAANWLPHRYFALIAGLVQFLGCIGGIAGEAMLAPFVNHWGWRESMWWIGIGTFAFALLVLLVVRDGKSKANSFAYDPLRLILAKFVALLKQPQVLFICLAGLLSWVPVMSVGALWGVPYLMAAKHWSNTQAANMCITFWICLGLGSPLVGWWSTRIGRRKPLLVYCFIAGVIGAVLFLYASSLSSWLVMLGLALLGFSASVQSLSFAVVKEIVAPERFATASGLNNMAAILGGAVAQFAVGLLVSWHAGFIAGAKVHYQVADYQFGFSFLPVCAILGVFLSGFFIRETYCRQAIKD